MFAVLGWAAWSSPRSLRHRGCCGRWPTRRGSRCSGCCASTGRRPPPPWRPGSASTPARRRTTCVSSPSTASSSTTTSAATAGTGGGRPRTSRRSPARCRPGPRTARRSTPTCRPWPSSTPSNCRRRSKRCALLPLRWREASTLSDYHVRVTAEHAEQLTSKMHELFMELREDADDDPDAVDFVFQFQAFPRPGHVGGGGVEQLQAPPYAARRLPRRRRDLLCGTRVSMIAIPWLVLTTTGSASQTGLVAFAELLPLVVVQALAGPVIDRLGARRVAITGDLLSMVVVGLIPLLHLAGALSFPALLALVAVAGGLRGAGDGAKHAFVPALSAHARGLPRAHDRAGLRGRADRQLRRRGPGGIPGRTRRPGQRADRRRGLLRSLRGGVRVVHRVHACQAARRAAGRDDVRAGASRGLGLPAS